MIMVLLTLVFSLQFSVFAEEEKTPLITIEAEKPDENGIFDLVVSMEDAHFLVYELAIKFDKTAVVPVDTEGNPAEGFDDFAEENVIKGISYIGTEYDAEKGLFLFTGYVTPGSTGDNFADKMVYFDEKTELYRFTFKVLEEKDYGFDIASFFNGDVYHEFFEDGAIISSSLDDEKRYVADIVIKYADVSKETKTAYYFYSELYPNNYTKEQRLSGTVYVVNDDYAAAVNGVLCAIDPANKSVVPYQKDAEQYLPLRFICESLGYTVSWDEATEQVTITGKNGNNTLLDTKASEGVQVVHDRTMVSVGLLEKLIDARVYDAETGEFVIYTSIVEWTPEREAEQQALDAMRYVLLPFFRMFV